MGRVGLLKPYMRPIYPGAQVSGTAVTVLLHPGDNWMMHVVAEQIQPGDIVVAAITAECTDGYFGDLLATSFMARGARALIIDAGVRDVKDADRDGLSRLEQMRQRQGHDQGDARLGQYPDRLRRRRSCKPGDAIVADDDGVVVVPAAWAGKTLDAGRRARGQRGRQARQARPGVLGLDMYKMREPLEKAGLKYID